MDVRSKKVMKSFLKECIILDINKPIKEEVVSLRVKYKVKLPDSIIVATAKYLDLPLITADTGFKKFENELNLVFYEV